MVLWDKDVPPNWRKKNGNKEPIATHRGWEDPDTGEVIVAIGGLKTKAGEANIREIVFEETAYSQGDPLGVKVRFNEKVDVTAGATIVISWDGGSGNITLHAAEQLDAYEITFDKQADNVTDEVVPSEAGNLSVGAQTISGTVVDTGTAVASNLSVSAEIASSAGTIAVA